MGATETMEAYLNYIMTVASDLNKPLRPVHSIVPGDTLDASVRFHRHPDPRGVVDARDNSEVVPFTLALKCVGAIEGVREDDEVPSAKISTSVVDPSTVLFGPQRCHLDSTVVTPRGERLGDDLCERSHRCAASNCSRHLQQQGFVWFVQPIYCLMSSLTQLTPGGAAPSTHTWPSRRACPEDVTRQCDIVFDAREVVLLCLQRINKLWTKSVRQLRSLKSGCVYAQAAARNASTL